ncbi:MAG TPA: CHRD domain-containing protein [Anaerolineae bacterium]|nr:CHRD domain-containing protein [Anaerolineae bacterium]HIP70510.1 CHRD domain-containing protein [Anaerolineae bacterium]
MKSGKRILLLVLLTSVLLSVPAAVFARKQVFKARLTTAAETHEVVDSNGRGSAIIGLTPDSIRFFVSANKLSGPATAVHIHGPAAEGQDAGVVVPLCGSPGAVLAECTMENGALKISGNIKTQLTGMTPGEFIRALRDGMLYVNVHTELNPAGEIRGQLYPR